MAWIESHQTIWDHPKTRKASAKLGIEPVQLVGHLHALWHWALDHAEDGDLSKYDADDIAIAARWTGDSKQFVDVLAECGSGGSHGFVERSDYGLRLRNWDRYTDRLVARRESSRKANHDRWHAERGVRSDACEFCADSDPPSDPPPPEPPPDPDASESESDRNPDGLPSDGDRNPDASESESTRPDPTGPDQPEPNLNRGASRDKSRSDRATRLPDGWNPEPDSKLKAEADQAGVNMARELERFRDHFTAAPGAKGRKVDWQATWRNWIRRSIDDRPRQNGSARPPPPSHQVSDFTESGMVQP